MTAWSQGYVTDAAYTRSTYHEMYPTRMALAALTGGQLPPDLTRPFRYADLGCGLGLTATVIAATYPWAEVWGFDFNPAHIDAARRLADAAELPNLHFEEASFAELAERPAAALPMFDFIAAHGVMSWIAPAARADLLRVIGQRLAPGGLVYLGYNTGPGTAALMPMQTLINMLVKASPDPSDQAVRGALDYLGILRTAGARYFAANPAAAARLDDLGNNDPRYLAHEWANAHWTPLMFADVTAAMAEVKCGFVASCYPAGSIDVVAVPPDMQPLVAEATDIVLKETLRDFASANGFRRDVFRRGLLPTSPFEISQRLEAIEFAWVAPPPADPLVLKVPMGEVTGMPEIYRPMTEFLHGQGSATLNLLRQLPELSRRPAADLLQAMLLLLSNGMVRPMLPETVRHRSMAPTLRLNLAMAEADVMGADLRRLACAGLGGDIVVDPIEVLVAREHLAGRSIAPADAAERVVAALMRTGRSLQKDGQPVLDMDHARTLMMETVSGIVANRFPVFTRLGALPA